MRFHLLGVGSIGSLVGFHLRRSIRAQRYQLDQPSNSKARKQLLLSFLSNERSSKPATTNLPSTSHIPPHVTPHLPDARTTSVTLHVRERSVAKQINKKLSNAICIERSGNRDIEGGFRVERSSAASDVIASVVRADAEGSGLFSISRDATTSPPSASSTPIPDKEDGVSIISTLEGTHVHPRHSPIDSLIITTKCDATVAALRPLVPRIHPWTTIVLIQNGMGVMDTLIERLFKDPEKRPNFVLGTTTHGVWRKAPLNVVHAGVGELHFSVVPNARAGEQGFERMLEPEVAARSIESVADTELPPLRRPVGSGWDLFAPKPESNGAAASRQPEVDGSAAPPTGPRLLDIEGIPDVPSLRTLRYTVSSLLALPLDVHWITVREYQLKALRKLAINACINPLTALSDCKNGDLFANASATDAIWSVCVEVSQVLEAQVREYLDNDDAGADADPVPPSAQRHARRASRRPSLQSAASLPTADLTMRTSPSGRPMLDPALSAQSLYQDVQRAIRLTASNWSSMHGDIKARRGSTEIDYINGYVSALGRGYGVPTPANDLLTSLVKLKTGKMTGS